MNRELNFRKTNLSTNVEWITEEGNKGKGSSQAAIAIAS